MEFAAALPLKQHVTGPTSGAAVDIYEPFNPSGPISALLVTDPVIEQTRVTSMLLRLDCPYCPVQSVDRSYPAETLVNGTM